MAVGMHEKIALDTITMTRRSRTDGYINFGTKPDGSQFRIPVIIIEGKKSGPVLLVDACTHGDEYEGAEAIIAMAAHLESADFSGTFIGVPALNLEAFSTISRASTTDGQNLNRIFPGNPDTYITMRLADIYLKRVVKHVDAVITFHGGGDVLHLEPIVGYLPTDDAIGKSARLMAQAFNAGYTWRMQNLPFEGVSAQSYRKLFGIPCILPEVGSHCDRLQNRQPNIGICQDGIRNVMMHLGMLSGTMPEQVKQLDVELHYIHASNGGIQTLLKKENEFVQKGELLGRITDVFGNTVEELKAPYPGVVIGFWSVPVIRPGDWWYLFAKVLD